MNNPDKRHLHPRTAEAILASHRRHALTSLVILLAIGAVILATSFLVAGRPGAMLTSALLAGAFFLMPQVPGTFLMKQLGARPLSPLEVPWLYHEAATLSARAGLRRPPVIYALPSPEMNAVTMESGAGRPIIAITRGLAERLSRRQLAGVLAHELAHLRNGDLRWMTLANIGLKLTTIIYRVGLLLMALSLPLALTGRGRVPLLGGLLLFAAPVAVQLLALALSRSREFDADTVAAALTGDPEGLASALETLESAHHPLWARLMWPVRRPPQRKRSSWLESHPAPSIRAARLRAIGGS